MLLSAFIDAQVNSLITLRRNLKVLSGSLLDANERTPHVKLVIVQNRICQF